MFKLVYQKINGNLEHNDWFDLFAYVVFLKWLFVLVYMFFVSALIQWTFKKKVKIIYRIIIHSFLSVFLFFFVFSLGSLYIYTFAHFTVEQAIANMSFYKYLSEMIEIFLIYFSLIGIIHGYYYLKKIKDIEFQKSQIQIQLAQSKLNILKSQIQPSFIFNTLDSISALIEIDEEQSQNLIAEFGGLFRGIIENKDENIIPLHKELEFLRMHISIISISNPKNFTFTEDIENQTEDILVPSIIVQPVLETTIKCFPITNKTPLDIRFSVYKEQGQLIISIEKIGVIERKSFLNSFRNEENIINLNARLQTLYKENFAFSISEVNGIIITQFKIPIFQ
jgi:hypothetical protein